MVDVINAYIQSSSIKDSFLPCNTTPILFGLSCKKDVLHMGHLDRRTSTIYLFHVIFSFQISANKVEKLEIVKYCIGAIWLTNFLNLKLNFKGKQHRSLYILQVVLSSHLILFFTFINYLSLLICFLRFIEETTSNYSIF